MALTMRTCINMYYGMGILLPTISDDFDSKNDGHHVFSGNRSTGDSCGNHPTVIQKNGEQGVICIDI